MKHMFWEKGAYAEANAVSAGLRRLRFKHPLNIWY